MKAEKQYSHELSVEQLDAWKARAKRAESDARELRNALNDLLPYLGTWVEDYYDTDSQYVAYKKASALLNPEAAK